MDGEQFNASTWIGQPSKVGLKNGTLLAAIKVGASASNWNVSLSWSFLSFFTKANIFVTKIDFAGASLVVQQLAMVIHGSDGSEIRLQLKNEEEKKDWVVAIGSLMQLHQPHWKGHEVLPIFELLTARAIQLASNTQTTQQTETTLILRSSILAIISAFIVPSDTRLSKVQDTIASFASTLKTCLTEGAPSVVAEAMAVLAKKVIVLAQLDVPLSTKSQSVNEQNAAWNNFLLQQQQQDDQQEVNQQQTQQKPNTAPKSRPLSSSLSAVPLESSSPSTSSILYSGSTANQTSLSNTNAAPKSLQFSKTNAKGQSLDFSSVQQSSNSSSPQSSSPTSIGSSSPTFNRHSDGKSPSTEIPAGRRIAGTISASTSSPSSSKSYATATSGQLSRIGQFEIELDSETAETIQELLLRQVKEVRMLFVKGVESFKSGNKEAFIQVEIDTEKSFDHLKAAFDSMMRRLNSQTVIARLQDMAVKYFNSWQQANFLVKSVFDEQDKNVAYNFLRERLPAVGEAMGSCSHALSGAVFEAAQQLHAENEVNETVKLFLDPSSKIAQFIMGNNAVKAGNSPNLSSRDISPPVSPTHQYRHMISKILASAQAIVRIGRSCFFDSLSSDDLDVHLKGLEKAYLALDKIIGDETITDTLDELHRTLFLDATYSTRDFTKLLLQIFQSVALWEPLSGTSQPGIIQSLANRRGSTQDFNSKLASAQLQFSSAAKQMASELERLIELTYQSATYSGNNSDPAPLSPTSSSSSSIQSSSGSSPAQTAGRFTAASSTQFIVHTRLSSMANRDYITPNSNNNHVAGNDSVSTLVSGSSPPSDYSSWSKSSSPSILTHSSSSSLQSSSNSSINANISNKSPSTDSIGWRKSKPVLNSPTSPRATIDNPPSDPPPPRPEATKNTSSTLTNASKTNLDMSEFNSGAGIGGAVKRAGLAASSPGGSTKSDPSSSKPSTPKPIVKTLSISIKGYEIVFPESTNMWLEPDEGNFKYLKGSELETDATNAANTSSSSGHSRDASLGATSQRGISSTKISVPKATGGRSISDEYDNDDSKLPSTSAILKATKSSSALTTITGGVKPEPVLASATLNKLVMKLTSESTVDVYFLKSFLATYRSFTTPEEFWIKLLERYNVPERPANSLLSIEAYTQQVILPIKLRVCNVIGKWLAQCWNDFSDPLFFHVESFIDETLIMGEVRSLQKKLKISIEKAKAEKKASQMADLAKSGRSRARQERAKAFEQVMHTARAQKVLDPSTFFLVEDFTPQTIAEHLTMLDWGYYSKIQHVELLNKSWSRDDKWTSPNIRKMIQRFNEVSSWVASSILWQEMMEKRVKVYCKIIQVANCLYNLHNFNCTLAIISGLNNAAIHRLKFTHAELPKKDKLLLSTLMDKMSSQGSYKEYRNTIKNVSPPIVPYLGVYLTDLTFIEDGNPDNIGHLINFHKRRLVYKVLTEIEQYQLTAFNLPNDPKLSLALAKLTYADDNELYNLSLLREPRNAERGDIR